MPIVRMFATVSHPVQCCLFPIPEGLRCCNVAASGQPQVQRSLLEMQIAYISASLAAVLTLVPSCVVRADSLQDARDSRSLKPQPSNAFARL